MMHWLLNKLGLQVIYICDWGFYHTRYGGADFHAMRPIHREMGCAPPWATATIVRRGGRWARYAR